MIMSAAMKQCNKTQQREEGEWNSLQPPGLQSEDSTSCDSVLEVCGNQTVDHGLEQHLTTTGGGRGEATEHKATFYDALQGLEAARKYMSI
jgi:hypothetical protein